jgi:hypothetical protein
MYSLFVETVTPLATDAPSTGALLVPLTVSSDQMPPLFTQKLTVPLVPSVLTNSASVALEMFEPVVPLGNVERSN